MESNEKSKGYAKLSIHSVTENIIPLKGKSKRGGNDKYSAAKSGVPILPSLGGKFTPLDGSAAPVDRYSKIYVAFILSGIGYMLPYTCFIVAVDYYQNRFPHSTVIFDMTTATIIVGTVGVLLNNALVETVSLMWRVMIGYIMSTSLLLFLTICDVTLDVFPHDAAYWVTLVSVSAISIGCAVQQSSFYGYANMLPRRYTQAVMVGESFAGVLVSLNRIITKLLLKDERINTTIFFIISIFVIGICCFTFTAFKLTQGQYACFEFEVPPRQDHNKDTSTSSDCTEKTSSAKVNDQSLEETACRQGRNSDVSFKGPRLKARWEVTKQIYPYMTSFGLTFYVSVSLYPGIISEVVSCRLGTWMPVLLMACFNLTDAFGKTLTSIKQTYSKLRLLLCSLARFSLIPLAIMCCKPRYHPILSGEVWPVLVTIVLGASNGYFGSLPLVMAPSQVAPRHRELCGNTMMLSFTFGVICGAVTSYGLDLLIGPHPDMEFCGNVLNRTNTAGLEVTARTVN
ncbi:unnamed protein product [Candidula unifasciata]|uniref:Equilibrative nucleoside transporter 4 n=1 Tax=Candidula unifasciata TaxID=100452 RepID=A0A8S3ZDN1_9EUPU|nr:unnamed protein product [Candidula unifasciata]